MGKVSLSKDISMQEALWQLEQGKAVASPLPHCGSKPTLETPGTAFFLLGTLPVIAMADLSKK